MKLFEIALPVFENNGRSYEASLLAWEELALERAGGFTRRPDGVGQWGDCDRGRIYEDVMRPYHVACSAETMAALLADAFKLFPDQVAIFVAEIGTATIHYRA